MKPLSMSPAAIRPKIPTENTLKPPGKTFSAAMKAADHAPSAGEKVTGHLSAFVDRVESDRKQVDRTIRGAHAGRDLDAVELLRVQALLYDYSQRVELATKVVSSATSGVKQLLNTQV